MSEAYSLYPQLNQSRSPASAWILAYLPMLDPSMVESSLARFSASFESEFLGMPVVLETPG
ncbi:MAG TPA: hypothetical protein PK765_00395 [bacterium]|nr:hypothetical protein [bacterium]